MPGATDPSAGGAGGVAPRRRNPAAFTASADSPFERDAASYRDPSGFVFWHEGVPYRQIQRRFAAEWDAFESSPLMARLIDEARLVRHERIDTSLAPGAQAHALIRPEPIAFISYPYEWTFGELRDAALLTLDVQLDALAAGWTLRDASAYNVQFHDGRPILIDSLSFEPHEDGTPWLAYRQFCEHFLAPLAVMAQRHIGLAGLLRANPDGIPLDLAARLLPWRTRLNFGLLSHLHLHARAQRRYADAADGGTSRQGPRMSRGRLVALVTNLRTTVAGLDWRPGGTEWVDYADNTSYSDAATAAKASLVDAFLRRVPGEQVWDLGANTGHYSSIAAATGKRVLAFDIDPAAAELHYRRLKREGRTTILPLVLDVANPSPGLGWANRERRSLLERAGADVVLALALVHHLAISRNVPLPMILALFADLAPWAIVEFVPKDDPMTRRLLAARRDVFDDYGVDGFRAAAVDRYEVVAEEVIPDTSRVLFLLRRR